MKRDMDLIRALLIRLEADDHSRLEGWDAETVGHHSYLMVEAGLARGNDITAMSDMHRTVILHELTWDGHEMLDAIRSDSVWKKVKKRVGKESLSAPLEIMKQLAIAVLKDQLFP